MAGVVMVVLATEVLDKLRMTVDEYMALDLPEGARYELVEGVVEVSPVPNVTHDAVIERLHRIFVLYSVQHAEIVAYITQKSGVILRKRDTAREPDFAVYGPSEKPLPGRRTWEHAKPALVVEVVSPDSRYRDLEQKPIDFWQAGVGEYWVFDPERHELTCFHRGDDGWNRSTLGAGAVFEPGSFPGMKISLDDLFHYS